MAVGLWPSNALRAQVSIRDSAIHMFLPTISVGFYGPFQDMATRVPWAGQVGLEVAGQLKWHVYLSAGATFFFADGARENPIGPNLLSYGQLIDENGRLIDFNVSMRGFTIPFRLGYVFHKARFKLTNPNCGLFLEAGIQYIRHQLYIATSRGLPLLAGDYRYGYDRLTDGAGALFSLGYRHFGNRRLANFFVAVDAQLNFTQNRRGYNYDQRQVDTRQRNDFLVGLRLGWHIPVYKQASQEDYYY